MCVGVCVGVCGGCVFTDPTFIYESVYSWTRHLSHDNISTQHAHAPAKLTRICTLSVGTMSANKNLARGNASTAVQQVEPARKGGGVERVEERGRGIPVCILISKDFWGLFCFMAIEEGGGRKNEKRKRESRIGANR